MLNGQNVKALETQTLIRDISVAGSCGVTTSWAIDIAGPVIIWQIMSKATPRLLRDAFAELSPANSSNNDKL